MEPSGSRQAGPRETAAVRRPSMIARPSHSSPPTSSDLGGMRCTSEFSRADVCTPRVDRGERTIRPREHTERRLIIKRSFGAKLRIPLSVLALVAAPALAAIRWNPEHAETVMEGARATLSEAVSTAEANVGSMALGAWLEQRERQDFYDVHVINGDAMTDVRVSLSDGAVMSTKPIEPGHTANALPAAAEKSGQPVEGDWAVGRVLFRTPVLVDCNG